MSRTPRSVWRHVDEDSMARSVVMPSPGGHHVRLLAEPMVTPIPSRQDPYEDAPAPRAAAVVSDEPLPDMTPGLVKLAEQLLRWYPAPARAAEMARVFHARQPDRRYLAVAAYLDRQAQQQAGLTDPRD